MSSTKNSVLDEYSSKAYTTLRVVHNYINHPIEWFVK